MESKEHRQGLPRENVAQDANFWQYKLIVDIRRLFSENCHQSGVGWFWNRRFCSFPVAISSRKFQKWGWHYCALWQQPVLLTSITVTLNDPECPLHLKCYFITSCHMGRQTGVKQPKWYFFHLVQRYFCDILRCCCLYVITKAINGFLMTQRQVTLKDVCG